MTTELKRRLPAEDGADIEMSDCDIFDVMKAGFLIRKCNLGSDNTIYLFSHPGVRALSSQLDKMRAHIVVRFLCSSASTTNFYERNLTTILVHTGMYQKVTREGDERALTQQASCNLPLLDQVPPFGCDRYRRHRKVSIDP